MEHVSEVLVPYLRAVNMTPFSFQGKKKIIKCKFKSNRINILQGRNFSTSDPLIHSNRTPSLFEIIFKFLFSECSCFWLFTRITRPIQKLHNVNVSLFVPQNRMCSQWISCFKLLCAQVTRNWKRHDAFLAWFNRSTHFSLEIRGMLKVRS